MFVWPPFSLWPPRVIFALKTKGTKKIRTYFSLKKTKSLGCDNHLFDFQLRSFQRYIGHTIFTARFRSATREFVSPQTDSHLGKNGKNWISFHHTSISLAFHVLVFTCECVSVAFPNIQTVCKSLNTATSWLVGTFFARNWKLNTNTHSSW